MADAQTMTPYSTVAPFFGATPAYVREEDAERINSYLAYEQIYWNDPNAYKVIGRGDDFDAIYVPNGRTIVDTTNRYVASGFDFSVTPGSDPQLFGTPEQQALAQANMTALFRRERLKSRFAMNKRYGLMRGDWLWHIVGDPVKPQGSRLSIHAVDPASWFPIWNDEDPDKMDGVALVDVFYDSNGDAKIKRLLYLKDESGLIIMQEDIWKVDEWFKADASPEGVITPATALPADITAFPVYHIPNSEQPGTIYGSSELRGVERLIQAVSQSVTDEDLALALEGLGVYATASGAPVNDDGEEIPWSIYPGSVLENVQDFKRVNGVSSLAPYDSHINRLLQFLKESSATPDVAIGRVEVDVAESGVALALQLGPMLAKAEEKDQIILDVHTQMFYDLKAWFRVYEQVDFGLAEILPVIGDKLPVNVDKEIERATVMIDEGLWSKKTAREVLAKKGIFFAADEDQRIADEGGTAQQEEANLNGRVASELSTLGGSSTE